MNKTITFVVSAVAVAALFASATRLQDIVLHSQCRANWPGLDDTSLYDVMVS